MKNDQEKAKEYLMEADKVLFSYQCPYLAFGKVIGFIDDDFVKNNPSNFSRLSMRLMMKSAGIDDHRLSQFIYESIECGYTLKQIAEML